MPPERSIDIDDAFDLKIVERLKMKINYLKKFSLKNKKVFIFEEC